ncbi:MAG: hypothetical protein K8R60_02395 [Burkholderiales bacterium]|nr:hypothetical protein [Burkholderiales bacterium]
MKSAPAVDRRSFLFRAMRLAAVPAFPALLVGCGGGGSDQGDAGGEAPPAAFTLDGQVVLPAGLGLAGASVSLVLGQTAVSPAGAFQAPFAAGGICFSQVRDAAGNVLVFGFLRAEQTTLSTRSTAEALVYRALGLWAHAPSVRVAALTLLRSEDLATVEAAVVSAIAAGGAKWASSANVGVSSAVRAKVVSMIGAPPAAAAARKSAQGMIVSPTERVSGLILEGDGIGACTVTNQFRRRSLLVHTETIAKLETGDEFPLPEHLVRTEMSPMDGLSSPMQAVADLWFERKSLYTPLTVSLATPRFPDTAMYTRYKVYGIGPGVSPGTWADLPESIKTEGIVLIIKSVVLDFVLPLIASVVVVMSDEKIDDLVQSTEANDVLKDLVNYLAQVPSLVSLLLAGDFSGLCNAVLTFIRGTDSLQIALFSLISDSLVKKFGPTVIDPVKKLPVDINKAIYENWSMIDGILDVGEAGFTAFDSAIQALDIGSSRLAETWDVTVTKAKVTLNPMEFFVEKNTLFSGITAVAVDASQVEGKVFGYRWKCAAGHLSDGSKYGPVIDSTTINSVAYDAADVPAGTVDQVDVSVFLSGFGIDDPVGSAKAKVYVTGVTVTPAEKKGLKASESVTLTAATVGMRPLAAGETVTYKWTLGGTAGTLTATDKATATFKADTTREGLALVTVEAFLGDKRIGSAQSSLTVGNKLVVAGRLFEVHYKDENCHTGMYIAVPKVAGAKHYSVFVSGMRGPVFGTEYTWEIYVYPDGSVSPEWAPLGNEYTTGIGGGGGGGADCVDAPDGRWAAWYEGSTVSVTVTL